MRGRTRVAKTRMVLEVDVTRNRMTNSLPDDRMLAKIRDRMINNIRGLLRLGSIQ